MRAEDAVTYLRRKNLLDPDDVVRLGLEVRDATRRNANLRVAYRNGSGFFIKQAGPGDSSHALETEAGFYGLVARDDRLRAIRTHLPQLHLFDRDSQLLVLDLCPGESLAEMARSGHQVPAIGRQLAVALGACHEAVQVLDGDEPSSALFGPASPALWDPTPGPSIFQEVGPIQLDIIRLIQSHSDIQAILEGLSALWQPERLIHGDLRWGNIVVDRGSDGDEPRIRVVDWETTGIGDPAWDVGCIFFGYLAGCLDEESCSGEPESVGELFASRTARIQPDVSDFWRCYAEQTGLDRLRADALLRRAAMFCGARFIQHAFELTPGASVMSGLVVFVLQLAFNLLRRPDETPAVLLGIGPASVLA